MSTCDLSQLPGIWVAQDVHETKSSEFCYISDAFLQLLGISNKNKELLIGKTIADIPSKASECNAPLMETVKLLKSNKNKIRQLLVFPPVHDNFKHNSANQNLHLQSICQVS